MELRDYVDILRRRGWILIVVALLTSISAFFLSRLEKPMYRATVELNVEPARPDWGLSNTLKDLMRLYAANITTDKMAQKVITKEQLDMSPDTFRSKLHVKSDASTYTIRIDAEDTDPKIAMELAQATAEEFELERKQRNQDLDKRDRIYVTIRDNVRYASKIRPKPKVNALAGGILGLLIGALIVFVLEWSESDILRRPDSIEQTLEMPVLGAIPPHKTANA